MLARLTPEQSRVADETIAEHPNWSLGKLQKEIASRIGRSLSRQAINKRLDRLVRAGRQGDRCLCPVCGQAGTLQSISAHWRQMANSGKHPPFDRHRLISPYRAPGERRRLPDEGDIDNITLPDVLDNVDQLIASKVLTERDFYRERYLAARSELEKKELRVRELEHLLEGAKGPGGRYWADLQELLRRQTQDI